MKIRREAKTRLAAEARSRAQAAKLSDDVLLAAADDPYNFAELFARYAGIELYLSACYACEPDQTQRVVNRLWGMARRMGSQVRSLLAFDDAGRRCFLVGGRDKPAPVRASLYYLASELALDERAAQ